MRAVRSVRARASVLLRAARKRGGRCCRCSGAPLSRAASAGLQRQRLALIPGQQQQHGSAVQKDTFVPPPHIFPSILDSCVSFAALFVVLARGRLALPPAFQILAAFRALLFFFFCLSFSRSFCVWELPFLAFARSVPACIMAVYFGRGSAEEKGCGRGWVLFFALGLLCPPGCIFPLAPVRWKGDRGSASGRVRVSSSRELIVRRRGPAAAAPPEGLTSGRKGRGRRGGVLEYCMASAVPKAADGPRLPRQRLPGGAQARCR